MVYKLTAGEVLFWVARVCLFVCLFLCRQSQEVVNSDHRLLTGLKSCLYILSKIETKNVMKYWMMCSTAEYCHPANIDKVLLAVKYWWVRGEVCCASVQLDRTVLCHTVYCSHLSSFIWEILKSSSTCHHLLQKYGAGEQLRGPVHSMHADIPRKWREVVLTSVGGIVLTGSDTGSAMQCSETFSTSNARLNTPDIHSMCYSTSRAWLTLRWLGIHILALRTRDAPDTYTYHDVDTGTQYSRFAITRMLSVCQR